MPVVLEHQVVVEAAAVGGRRDPCVLDAETLLVECRRRARKAVAPPARIDQYSRRAAAARVLVDLRIGEAGRPEAFAALLHCLADGDEAVAPVVAQALVEMGEPAVAKLMPALERPELRGFALAVLVDLGPKAKAAQSTVQALTTDADPNIRAVATVALASIAGDDPAVVASNRRLVLDRLGLHDAVWLKARHGGDVAVVGEPAIGVPQVDATVTAEPGLPLAALSADCALIVLAVNLD